MPGTEKIILNLLQQLGKDHEVILYGVFTAGSKPRPFGVQSQHLLTEGEVLEDEFRATLNGGDDPAEKVSKPQPHNQFPAADSLYLIPREKCGLARCMLVSTQDGEIEILLAVSRVESGNLLELIQRGRKRAGLGGHAQLVKPIEGRRHI
jgi:hypothetical protein